MMVDSTTIRMTANEYFELSESTQPTALLDGEFIVSPSPIPKHQQTSADAYIYLRTLVPDGKWFYAPMDVYFDEINITQPDILWIRPDGKCKVGEKYLAGAPDFIIEILSPGSVRDDKIKKFKLYQQFDVSEYWIIDPIEQYVEVFTLIDGEYRLQGTYAPDGTFESLILGKIIELKRIFE